MLFSLVLHRVTLTLLKVSQSVAYVPQQYNEYQFMLYLPQPESLLQHHVDILLLTLYSTCIHSTRGEHEV